MEIHNKNSATINNPSQPENDENWHVSTWAHRAWFAAGCATMLFSISKSLTLTFHAPTSPRRWLESILAAVAGYLVADLISGIYHWAIDNYGSPETPFFGSHIEGFQYHHHHPLAITKRQLANNLHYAAAAVAVGASPITILSNSPALLLFVGLLGCGVIFTQHVHVWAHTPKGKLPPLAAALQDARIVLSRAEHAAHHRPPFNSNYCIFVGRWNRILDRYKFFARLEVVVEKVLGYKPRSWNELN